MALLTYNIIQEIRSVVDEYAEIERRRQAEVETRRAAAFAAGGRAGGSGRRRASRPHD